MTAPPLDRVAIVMTSAIGDAVRALPVVTAIKRHHPGSRITWVLEPGPAGLVRGHPDVHDVIELGAGTRRLPALASLRRSAGRFDLVVDLQVAFKAGLVTALLRSPVKLGFDRARARDLNWLFTTRRIPAHHPQHVQDQYLEFLDAIAVPREPVTWNLGPWPHELDWRDTFAATFDRPVVALGVASSEREREWPAERWGRLADALWHDFGLHPVVVGASSRREREIEAAIRARARVPIRGTLGASLRQLVAILDASSLVVAVNSAPLHISVALDHPAVGLVGYRNPRRTGPWRFRDLMVDGFGRPGEAYDAGAGARPDGMNRITVADVLDRVSRWASAYGPAWRR